MPQQSFHLSLQQQLAQQVVEDAIATSLDLCPTSSAQVDPCSAVLINGPCSLDKNVVQPPGFDYPLAGPHLAIDATFPIPNTEEATLSPTVLGNPTLAAVVVPHDTDPMFIREVAAHLTIHAASPGEKNIHNGKLPIYEVTVQVTFTDEA